MCYELAKSKFNIVLMSRTQSKMEKVAEKLRTEYNVEAKIIQYDFADLVDKQDVDRMHALLDKIDEDVSILINNVGMAYVRPIGETSTETIMDLTRINAMSSMFTTSYYLPKFIERYQKEGKKSAIIAVNGQSCLNVQPNFAVYTASKSYRRAITLGAGKEHPNEIDVFSVLPGGIHTAMNAGTMMFTLPREKVAKAIIDQMGYETESRGHWLHEFEGTMRTKFWLANKFVSYMNISRRAAYLKEKESQEGYTKSYLF